jgi:hypothetical protein
MYQKEPNRVIKFLKQIWPYIARGINSTLYFIINLIKTIIKQTINMIKTGGIE